MNRKVFLFLPLLLWAVTMVAGATVVPAMIVYGTDGNKQVVQLDATDVTDLVVLQARQSLLVDVPESHIIGVRSITFAMIDAGDVATAIESAARPIVRDVEKVVRDGQVILRVQLQSGAIVEYDVRGNKIINK